MWDRTDQATKNSVFSRTHDTVFTLIASIPWWAVLPFKAFIIKGYDFDNIDAHVTLAW